MKKIAILVILLAILSVGGYFGYKGYYLFYYGTEDIDISKGLTFESTITIKKVKAKDYVTYEDMKIRNDFKKFSKLEYLTGDTAQRYVLKGNDGNTKASFILSKDITFIDMLKADKNLYTTNKKVNSSNLSDFLTKNNINNDIELFKYLNTNVNTKNNIFMDVNDMKDNYQAYFIASVIMPKMESITLIDGDYEGYIFNLENAREVTILKNNKRYIFTFLNNNYFSLDQIKNLLNTIEIK